MTEDGGARVSVTESTEPHHASQSRQRKKRKWDQPAEMLVSAGVALPNVPPMGNVMLVGPVPLPGVVPPVSVVNPPAASGASITPLFQALSVPQQTTMVTKVNQPKIQDELTIAREIVINDAEASIRYKLTKRQTQEEIQRCTGAVVITRGKYRPPNAPPDGEKPLFLHISAGSHLKETAERVLAVDHAAAMVEEMMKQGPNSQAGSYGSQAASSLKPLSTCVYLGFEADPSLNVAARIRGPNDQYINHIMNETGATVVLRGRGSGNPDNQHDEDAQQPLHLLLSSSNPKSLEDAKRLAENLLDTISVEFGASRVSSHKVYGAVPPPQQLLSGIQGPEKEPKTNSSPESVSAAPMPGIMPPSPASSFSVPLSPCMYPYPQLLQPSGILNGVQPPPNVICYPQPLTSGGTSYSGYAGIYPQVTPLQQVALALRQSASPVISTVTPTISAVNSALNSSVSSGSEKKEKQPPQKRKFQELTVGSTGPAKTDQGSEPLKQSDATSDLGLRNTLTMPAPKSVQPSSNGMQPQPPPKGMPPPTSRSMPPPPPKFPSSAPSSKPSSIPQDNNNMMNKSKPDPVPDTLVKLLEYGEDDDDDDDEDDGEKPTGTGSSSASARKPFWAL